jgi:cytochrome P450
METPPDLKHPDFISDPHSVYLGLRTEEPIHWNPSVKGWVVTRYADISTVLKDPRFSVAKLQPFLNHVGPSARSKIESVSAVLADWMVFNDPPQHGRLRKALARYFLPQEIVRLRPMILQRVEELIDGFRGHDRVDFIESFAFPLPARVISELFGVPRDRVGDLGRWSESLKDFVALARATPDKYDRARAAVIEMGAFFRETLRGHRRNPRDDLTGRLLEAGAGREGLSEDEMVATLVLLLFAGHETTASLLANGLYWLLRSPASIEALRSSPSLIPGAVEEMLRYEGPAQTVTRIAAEDVRLADVNIRRGERVFLALNSAARDPAVFHEPDSFKVDRTNNRHIAFGHGIHVCLGAPLARLEAQIAFDRLLSRLSSIRLETPQPEWHDELVTRSMERLFISYDMAA